MISPTLVKEILSPDENPIVYDHGSEIRRRELDDMARLVSGCVFRDLSRQSRAETVKLVLLAVLIRTIKDSR